jgi:GT2 family glycosyltransferase
MKSKERQGSIPSRDRAFRAVKSELIVTLDDDSYPSDPAFLQKASDVVAAHPECGAITFPEIRDGGQPADLELSPMSPGKYVRDFPNCAGVMIRDCYGRVAEYPSFFSHAHAEPDYCLQLYAAGYAVWFEPSLTVRHHFTPVRRSMRDRHGLNARNELWSTVMRSPLSLLWFMAPWRVLRQLVFALFQGWAWLVREPLWWIDAARGMPRAWRRRLPVDTRVYWNWVWLGRFPASSLEELERRFARSFGRGPAVFGKRRVETTIMITTRNRIADLGHTLDVLQSLDPPPLEVLITADGCTDETAIVVRERFPQYRLCINDHSIGSVPSRDRMIRDAQGDLIVSLDDDSYPLDTNFLARLPEMFDAHPDAAVLTFSELRDGGVYSTGSRTPHSKGHYVSAYPNCAAAMRRDVYLESSGYPPFFVHAYEEPDYALQCYGAGYAVWFEPSITIRHHLAADNRSPFHFHQLNARNELWSVWLRCPWPWLPLVSAWRVWRQFQYACSEGFSWAINEPRWWWAAMRGAGQCWRRRRPIKWSTYYHWMRLARHPRYAPRAFQAPLAQLAKT